MPVLTRRRAAWLPLALGSLACGAVGPSAAATLPSPMSLAQELAAALAAGKPLVVMVSLDGCPFCKVVRDNYLAPLRRDTAQPVVQLDMGSRRQVRDFQGVPKAHDEVIRALDVKVAPTVLFFGAKGLEVAARLAGASIPDFYGAYLDDRLRVALRAVG